MNPTYPRAREDAHIFKELENLEHKYNFCSPEFTSSEVSYKAEAEPKPGLGGHDDDEEEDQIYTEISRVHTSGSGPIIPWLCWFSVC